MHGKRLLLTSLLIGSLFFSLVAWATPENLAFILDASNSMNKPFDGESRLDVAKGALSELLEIFPEGVNVGLLIYGHRIAKGDREASCQDIEPLFSLLPFDASVGEEMTAAFLGVRAQGLTPLADALVEASNEISAFSGESAIVLISDGEETCGGDPLVVAQMIATMTPPTLLHVIGLDVEEQVRANMIAMAEATGGEYRDVSEAKDLFAALFAVISPPEQPTAPVVPSEYACFGITSVVWGTEGNDTLYGTPGNDLIYGLGGNDLIIGLDGNDILLGGEGNDILEGGDGNDALIGDPGDDRLFGAAGNDVLCGGPGDDSLEGERGDDILYGGVGNDKLLGGPGNNQLYRIDGCDILLEGMVIEGPYPGCRFLNLTCPFASVCPPAAPVAPLCAPPSGKYVDEGASIKLHGTVVDHDCNVAEVYWQAEAGRFDDPTSLEPIYYAPLTDRCEGEDVLITLTATDSCGATGRDSFGLHINNVNHLPVAVAGEDLAVDECASVKLTCSASDPDGDVLTYCWTAECGRGTFDDPTLLHPCYTAPATDRCEGEKIVLTLTVRDACGLSSSDSLTVHVNNLNLPPVVKADP